MARHALLVGVAEFDDPRLNRLNAPLADVKKLAELLRDPARGAFDTVNTVTSGDFQETRNAMLAVLLRNRVPDDLILLYYSGHGVLAADGELYFATRAIDMELPLDGGIAAADARDWLNRSRAGKRIVLLDCCHSGAFPGSRKDAADQSVLRRETLASPAEGQYVLTASGRLQFAYDAASDGAMGGGAARYSRFTSWLIEGIENGAAAPSDEKITVGSLRDYVVRRAQEDGGVMRPQEFASGEARDLVVAYNPQPTTAVLPSEVRTKLLADSWETRAAAVSELTGYLAGRNAPRAAAARRLLEQRLDDEWDRRVHLLVERALAADAARPRDTTPEAARAATADAAPGAHKLPIQPPSPPRSEPPREDVGGRHHVHRRFLVGGLAGATIGGLAYLASLDTPSLKPSPPPRPNPAAGAAVAPRPAAPTTAQPPVPAAPPADWAAQRGQDQFGRFADILVGGVTQRLRWLPPGHFNMGSLPGEWGRDTDEGPRREVTLASGFWLFETPCTQALWRAVMGANPSKFQGPDHPVEGVTFEELGKFQEDINTMVPGLKLELPSEARWEYAARAGTLTATYNGDLAFDVATQRRVLDPIAWWSGNSDGQTHPVGQKRANAYGLRDMLGNVWECCADIYHLDYFGAPTDGSVWLNPRGIAAIHVIRGGSWASVPAASARRLAAATPPATAVASSGFAVPEFRKAER